MYNYTAFVKPFTFEVWLTIIISVSIIALISNNNIINKRRNDSKKCIRLHNTCSRSSKNYNKTSVMHFLMSSYLIAEAFLRLFYTSVLLSFLIMPPSSNIQTIPDHVKAEKEDNYRCSSFDTFQIYFLSARIQISKNLARV